MTSVRPLQNAILNGVLIMQNEKKISTLDLFENEYVLLVGSEGRAWLSAANQLTEKSGFPIKSYHIASDGDLSDPENNFHKIYEISSTGTVLVRPDGHVAWRSKVMLDNPEAQLENAFFKYSETQC